LWLGMAGMSARWSCVVLGAVLALGLSVSAAVAQSTATYTYDALGRVITATTPAGTTTYAYDAADNRTSYVAVTAGGNHAPVANNDGAPTAVAVAPGGSVVISVLANDTDADSDPLLVNSIVANGAKGVASITSGSGSITYVATAGQTGTDSFTYTAKDSHAAVSNTATVFVNISAAAPVAGAVTQHVAYNTTTNVVLSVTGSYTTATVVSAPSLGSATASSALINYTPGSGQTAATSFTYKVTGPGGVSNTATVSIIIDAPAAPTISGGSITTAYNTAGNSSLTLGGGPYTSIMVSSQGAKGVATISGSTATYTPNSGQTGSDSFIVQATGPGGTGTGTISVTIGAAATPLTATASPTSYSRIRDLSGWGPATAVTVTPAGGNGVYSYSWARLSGDSSFTIDNASGPTVTWLKPGALTVGVFTAVWRCTVSDTAGHSTTVDVPVEIDEENGS
jgi:YD repeat-containing protein